MQNIVIIDAQKWHWICHELQLDSYKDTAGRSEAFADYFKCTVRFNSRLDQWSGEDDSERPDPVMVLAFANPRDASFFALKWA